ncbi:MAG: hypothetical protein COA65_03705 [Rhodospirillaceae bacterium]|nr:MAG: hypothetical protein COA65_03705 [Rhodospirillaceae bacterium]
MFRYSQLLTCTRIFPPFRTRVRLYERTDTVNDVDDARLIAEMIVAPEGHESNHWKREACALITGLLLLIAVDLPPQSPHVIP